MNPTDFAFSNPAALNWLWAVLALAALVVVRAMQDQRGLVAKTLGQLQETHAELVGTVLMRPQHTAGGYFRKNAEIMAEYAKPEATAPVAAAKS